MLELEGPGGSSNQGEAYSAHSTEVRFTSFLFGGFTTVALMNPPDKTLEKRISVHSLLLASLNRIYLMYLEKEKCKIDYRRLL